METPPPNEKRLLMEAYRCMLARFGPRHWWPADTPFEVMVGAVLTQNTAWTNVEKAIRNIKAAGAFTLEKLNNAPEETLAQWIRPSGYFNLKAKRLKALTRFLSDTYGGNLEKMAEMPCSTLREQLLGVYGIGKETADSILLYALEKPIFVVDAYTRRIFSRHQLIAPDAGYDETQHFFMAHLPYDTQLFNEYHALIVETGKNYCRKKPLCEGCPLSGFNQVSRYVPPST